MIWLDQCGCVGLFAAGLAVGVFFFRESVYRRAIPVQVSVESTSDPAVVVRVTAVL